MAITNPFSLYNENFDFPIVISISWDYSTYSQQMNQSTRLQWLIRWSSELPHPQ